MTRRAVPPASDAPPDIAQAIGLARAILAGTLHAHGESGDPRILRPVASALCDLLRAAELLARRTGP
jgi:hypothetical protein